MIRFFKSEDGVSAVEFAIVAPMLILGVLSTADIGFEVSDRMEIDQAIRNGAEAALDDPGTLVVQAVLDASPTTVTGPEAISWAIDRLCVCPESNTTSVDCFATCDDDQPTEIYYQIEGSRDAVRILLPQKVVSRSVSVQVR